MIARPDQTLVAIAEKYDAVRYDARAYPVTHPDSIAAIAMMFGLDAPAVATARVLDVGCSDGSNLLPMAARLPDATFVGCDIARTAIAAAREATEALGLSNVTFIEADLSALEGGPYDYIIAHGVYSWVPQPVRDALFALAARALSPNGILFTSYNTYPGGYVRRAVWEGLRWHTRAVSERATELAAARAFAEMMADPGPTHEAADAAVRAEFRRVAAEAESLLYHDTLAEPNEPMWFHAFVAHAASHGLTYLAEAQPSMMAGGGLAPRVRQFLATQDRLSREQYLDIARVRRFRQSLLCRDRAATDFQLATRRLRSLRVSASMPLQRAAAENRWPDAPGADGVALRTLLEALVAATPAALAVDDLLGRVERARSAGGRSAEAVLVDAWVSGFAQLHAHAPNPATHASAHPEAFVIARWQAPKRDDVTNLRHETIRLVDPLARRLLPLCDGSRDRASLAHALAEGREPIDPTLAASIDDTLATFAQCALLVERS